MIQKIKRFKNKHRDEDIDIDLKLYHKIQTLQKTKDTISIFYEESLYACRMYVESMHILADKAKKMKLDYYQIRFIQSFLNHLKIFMSR